MAVGRISGPLLAQNLFRDNVPLAFYNTSSSEAPVLYLDVSAGRVGVKTDAPLYDLDIAGTARASELKTTTATIGNTYITSGTIETTVGPLTIRPGGLEQTIVDSDATFTKQVTLNGNIPSTDPTTGTLVITGGLGVTGDSNINGILTLTGNTPSTDATNGQMVVYGGMGVTQDLWVGGILHAVLSTSTVAGIAEDANNVRIVDPGVGVYYPMMTGGKIGYVTPQTSDLFAFDLDLQTFSAPKIVLTETGVLGLSVAGTAQFDDDVAILGAASVADATQSTTTDTGALVVTGGVGVGKNLNVGGELNVGSNLTVGGNIHAVGNITAEGNIQLGNSTGTDTLIVDAEIESDLTPKVDNTYNVGGPNNTWAEGYFNKLYSNILESQSGSININPADNLLQVNANIRVTGDRPIGTAPVVTNILYVTMDGSDTNDGRAEDPSRACRTISGALRSPYYTPGTSIKVAPGHYLEQNPMLLQPYTSIIGSDLRTTVIEAINKTQDLFHVQSGCYLFGMQFLNGRSGVLPGSYANGFNRGAYCIAFPPQVNGSKIDTFHSPYIQNCTNQTGPWLMDGTMFQPNQTVQVPSAVGTGTWIANTTTIVVTLTTGTISTGMSVNNGQQDPGFFNARTLLLANKPFIQEQVVAYVNQTYPGFEYQQAKCFRDVGIIIENIAYDSTFGGNQKSVEAGLAYYNGVQSVISGEESQTVDAINYINTLSQLVITNSVAPDLLSGTGTYQQVINTALTDGGIAGTSLLNNINIITTIINSGVGAAPEIYQSIGIDEDFVSAEILLQANRQFIQNDVMAWISNTYPNFSYNQALCYRDVGLIVDAVSQDILLGGNSKTLEAALSYWEGGYNQITGQATTTTEAISHAKDIALQIIANQSVSKQPAFTYSTATCQRDVGLIVDSLALDLKYQGTSQSAFAGLQYWNQAGYTGLIPEEITTTTNAITHLKGLMSVTASSLGNATVASTVTNCVDLILGILNSGTAGVTDQIVPNGDASSDSSVIAAYNGIVANKSTYQTSVISWITTNHPNFIYDHAKCSRDVGYIVDSVAFDLLHGGNRQSIMSGVYYYGFDATSTAVPGERPQVIAAYKHIKDIVSSIVKGVELTPYQTSVPQVLGYTNIGTDAEVEVLENCVDLITDIISNGPSVSPVHVPISLTGSTSNYVTYAYELLVANRNFITAEVTAYIDSINGNQLNQVTNSYFSGGEAAAEAVTRNFNIINDIIINGPAVAPIRYHGGGLFASTGIQVQETRLAPKVTSVTSLGGQNYQLTLDYPTIGIGTNATLYFGSTNVFPLQDSDVPDGWAQRRIDTRGGMGGMLVDGSVVSDRSPVGSMVLNAFTQVSQGGRGIHIINNGYAQLVSIFTIFCNVAVEVDSGGIASITNSNSNFGDICLVAKGYGDREFSGTIYNPPYPTNIPNGSYYPSGYWPQNGRVMIYVPDTANRPHIALIMEVEPPAGHINQQGLPGFLTAAPNTSTITTGSITISGIDTTDIAIGQTLYIRDQYGRTNDGSVDYLTSGTVITDVGYQTITLSKGINQGGGDINNPNYFTLYTCGKAYYSVLSSELTDNPVGVGLSLIPSQQTDESSALSYLSTTLQSVLDNIAITPINTTTSQVILSGVTGGIAAWNFIDDRLSIIADIAENGTGAAPTITTTGTITGGAGSAITLIEANTEFLAAEVVAYVDTISTATYDKSKCARDVKLVLQQLIYDLETGGNYYSVYSGLSYWSRAGTYHVVELSENLTNSALMPDGATVNFYQRSYMSASGYTFEYVGAGMNYGALPQVGRADPVQSKEVVQIDGGRVFFTSTDQNGDFRIGPGLVISQATGVLSGRTFTKSLFANLTPFILAIEAGA